jgi:DNA-directed RNA polymerase specialized sigma24 family protein
MPVSNDEFALSSQAARGDRHAFAVLVRRNEARVRSFLTRLAGVHLADDLAQETFLRAWRNAGRFRGSGSYVGWLLSIAWRVFLDAHKRHRTEQGRLGLALETTPAPTPPSKSTSKHCSPRSIPTNGHHWHYVSDKGGRTPKLPRSLQYRLAR